MSIFAAYFVMKSRWLLNGYPYLSIHLTLWRVFFFYPPSLAAGRDSIAAMREKSVLGLPMINSCMIQKQSRRIFVFFRQFTNARFNRVTMYIQLLQVHFIRS